MTLEVEGAQVVAVYQALKAAGRLRDVLLAEYRCPRGCLLAHVFQTPGRRSVLVPGYKLSPARNEEQTVPAARAGRTVDGDRRWRARGLDLDELAAFRTDDAAALVPVQCDHVAGGTLDPLDVLAAVAGTQPGRPTRRVVSVAG